MEYVSHFPEPYLQVYISPHTQKEKDTNKKDHAMGSPLVQTSSRFADEAWRPFKEIPAMNHCHHIQGTAMAINTAERIATYFDLAGEKIEKSLAYDYLVVATGTRRGWPIVPLAQDKARYLKDNSEHIESIKDAKRVVIVGGGWFFPRKLQSSGYSKADHKQVR